MAMIKDLVSKSSTCEFTLLDEVQVELRFVSRKDVIDLRAKCLTSVRNPRTGEMEQSVDVKKFDRELVRSTVVNWKGLKKKHLVDLNIGYAPETEEEGEELVPYDLDDAVDLMINSELFANFVNDNTKHYQTFAEAKKQAAVKKSSNSPKKD